LFNGGWLRAKPGHKNAIQGILHLVFISRKTLFLSFYIIHIQ